jgi:DNA-3-methyladenine glycosylase I
MNLNRCDWCKTDPLYIKYHDEEWGVPVYDDQKLFEYLILETFQAGLSWLTILKKRAHFKTAFDNFNFEVVAQYEACKIESLLHNEGIIRNHLKIKAAVSNAEAFIRIRELFGSFSNYIWNFTDGKPVVNFWKHVSDIPSSTSLSDRISKDLKTRGFKFVGSTIVYAHLQAMGMVDDHLTTCWKRQ